MYAWKRTTSQSVKVHKYSKAYVYLAKDESFFNTGFKNDKIFRFV
jgi:hypothetical protein